MAVVIIIAAKEEVRRSSIKSENLYREDVRN